MKKETKHNKVKIGLPKIIEILCNFTCEVFKPRIRCIENYNANKFLITTNVIIHLIVLIYY